MAVSKTRRTRILGAATAFIGVGAAGLVMAAPANAEVTSIKSNTPSGYGSSEGAYGTSCNYEIEAAVSTNVGDVTFAVTKPDGNTTSADPVTPSGLKATYEFTPDQVGTYTIKATQGTTSQSKKFEVKQGINLDPGGDTGSLTIVSPLQAGCLVIG